MSRELKFREWVHGKFHYWGFVNEGSFHGPATPSVTKGIHQQFTGLHDKNGKEAYYGDIIKHSTTEGGIFTRLISWSDELQCTMMDDMPYYRLHESGYIQPSKLEFEIIGNIYANPELLTTTP